MGAVDVQRAFRSMTVPPPTPHEGGRVAVMELEQDARDAVRIGDEAGPECADILAGSGDDCEMLARRTLVRLRPILRIRPQPLKLVLELLEVEFDLNHGCAERLFWLAHQRGYLTLSQGHVALGEEPEAV